MSVYSTHCVWCKEEVGLETPVCHNCFPTETNEGWYIHKHGKTVEWTVTMEIGMGIVNTRGIARANLINSKFDIYLNGVLQKPNKDYTEV